MGQVEFCLGWVVFEKSQVGSNQVGSNQVKLG